MRIAVAPQLEVEIEDAARTYERSLPGSGRALVNEIRRTLWSIEDVPDCGTARKNGIHRAILPRFPFWIAYRRQDDCIEALALMPSDVDADRLLSRLRSST